MRTAAWVISLWAVLSGAAVCEETAAAIGDAERGQKMFKRCQSCHELGEGAEHKVGPHLNGIFFRPAATFSDYKYSKGMFAAREGGLVWDIDGLSRFLEAPKKTVPHTKMSFKGMPKEQDRNDLLAYLRVFSDNPQNIPEAAPTARKVEVVLSPEILAIVGDPEYGEYLAAECTTCHQADGGNDGIPTITHWPTESFVIAMHAYKEKQRPHPVMQMMAGRLSDEEIAALAAYFEILE
ncbi:cytochrome c [Shimia gijangensis]|uniref:Cytochrome c n=1 Tax=Shimia gijangensis TaxID=1470563 RepID=A0A1M6P386_9RHOB|nr:c-type cytochrome [Shimia gijangensis]SHK02363.1 cytochrome c [Shimia gijangensis]